MIAKSGTVVRRDPFGKTPDGTAITIFTLTRDGCPETKVTNYGACLVSLRAPDREGVQQDVVLGYADLGGYLSDTAYMGAIVGRYANRIANGEFTLSGNRYKLARNNGPNHLHGGLEGFNTKVWSAAVITESEGEAVELHYVSPDGEEGYPGTLSVTVVYSLIREGGLRIEYTASADAETVVNLTNHAYFNLEGEGSADVHAHEIQIEADQFTPADETMIPIGEPHPVEGTPLDLRQPAVIADRIDVDHSQLQVGSGFDHNFVLRGETGALRRAARAYAPSSGRVLELLTTEPGVQFYTGNSLDGSLAGKSGVPYRRRAGFCLEAQHFPDSPNQRAFPSVVLRPGERYTQTTVYRLSVQR